MKIALIAGEASGDRLGGRLMAAMRSLSSLLRKQESGDCLAAEDAPRNAITFCGIGGVMMEAQGLRSFFPMQEISLMGFAEILPHALRLRRRIRETVAQIESENPAVVVTIDSPGFTFRVVKALRQRGKITPRYIHYVAPTVWAYKPKRAEKAAALFDHLLVLLPFEPPYFEEVGLATTFIGHPATEDDYAHAAQQAFRQRHHIAPEALLLCVMPGSRKGELRMLLPIFAEAVQKFYASLGHTAPPLALVIPSTEHAAQLLAQMPQVWPVTPLIVTEEAEKRAAMGAANLALAKSGTVTLEAALAGVPMLTAYKVHPLSAWLLRRMITTRYVNLINVLMQREVIPEYLQEECTSAHLAAGLLSIAKDAVKRETQQRDYAQALHVLASPQKGKTPSEVAAEIVMGNARQEG